VADALYSPPPSRRREKGGKRKDTYNLNIKTALLITLIILRITKKEKYIKI